MPHPTAVINCVGLSPSLISPEHTPTLHRLATGGCMRQLAPQLPAVTCTSQTAMLTGAPVSTHGIVANGWLDRSTKRLALWQQANTLVEAPKVWELARERDPSVTTLNMFWWFNMYSSAEYSVTPRPQYRADGRKIPDCASHPEHLRERLQKRLGPFPLFRFWGPMADITSTRWIADATIELSSELDPTLTLVYLPHLDYPLQKLGPEHPDIPRACRELDDEVAKLVDHFDSRGVRTLIVSEYGIAPCPQAGGQIHVNRFLRTELDALAFREEGGRGAGGLDLPGPLYEIPDPGASAAFSLADHQVAHVYVSDPARISEFRDALATLDGVDTVLTTDHMRVTNLQHERSGDLLLVAKPGRWFTYYHWLDDDRAPDYARTVDIHSKPGYDPVELFVDPAIRFPKARLGYKLLRKKVGLRTLMDVIPLDASLVRGTHGRAESPRALAPVLITQDAGRLSELPGPDSPMPMERVCDAVLSTLFD